MGIAQSSAERPSQSGSQDRPCARNGAEMEGIIAANLAAVRGRIEAAARAAGRAPGAGDARRRQQDPSGRGGARSADRGPSHLRREPGAGGGGKISGAARGVSRPGPAPDRTFADEQGQGCRRPLRRDRKRRPAAPRRSAGQGDGAQRAPRAVPDRGQYRRGAAEGGNSPGRGRRVRRSSAATGSACRSPG